MLCGSQIARGLALGLACQLGAGVRTPGEARGPPGLRRGADACPLFISEAPMRSGTSAPTSASSMMIAADLPPSSRVTRFSCSPHSAAMRLPAAVRAGEADLVDVRVGDEVLADLAPGRRRC